MNLQNALTEYATQLAADGRSPHTIAQYRRHLGLFATWLGAATDLAAITHQQLAAFFAAPVARTTPTGAVKRATSLNAMRSSLRTFFAYAHEAGLVAQNPARLVRRALCGTPPPKAMSTTDRDRLLATLAAAPGPEAARDCALFHLLVGTGVRIGSALALTPADVDLDRAELRIHTTKGDRPETVLMSTAIRDHMARYLPGRDDGRLFPITTRHAQRRLGEWLTAAGITQDASPHSLRHTFATQLYARTGDIALVQVALRHRSIASTMVYTRVATDRVRRALEA